MNPLDRLALINAEDEAERRRAELPRDPVKDEFRGVWATCDEAQEALTDGFRELWEQVQGCREGPNAIDVAVFMAWAVAKLEQRISALCGSRALGAAACRLGVQAHIEDAQVDLTPMFIHVSAKLN